jgi:primary-amine oxidase
VNVYRFGSIGVWRYVVSLTEGASSRRRMCRRLPDDPARGVREIEDAVKADPRFIEACAKRGIDDVSLVCVDPWSSGGDFGVPGEEGKHLAHTFCWLKTSMNDNLYAHPIEGLNAVVDIKTGEVIRVDDRTASSPVPKRTRTTTASSRPRPATT